VLSRALGAQQKTPGVIPEFHIAPKARRVIWLTMAGGPSHLETFDPKPVLAKEHGNAMPESLTKGQQLAQLQGAQLKCFGPQWALRSSANRAPKSANSSRISAASSTTSRSSAR
jgi:hypothetical protein